MKARNSPRPASKVSFAVDRDEIDISSEWVDEVLRRQPAGVKQARSTVQPSATVASPASVAQNATVEPKPRVENNATEEQNATVAENTTVVHEDTVEAPAPVAGNATVAYTATVAISKSEKIKPLRKITDGLTPAQFTLYSLMYSHGEPEGGEDSSRLYRGGYKDLCDLSGLSKRGVQNVIRELLDKRVIELHQAPGYHRTQTSVYRVFAEREVMSAWWNAGFRYAVGKGKALRGA